MIVYIITSGEYDEYSIERVYTDKQKAEEFIANNKGCRIETFRTSDDGYDPNEPYYRTVVSYRLIKNPVTLEYTVEQEDASCCIINERVKPADYTSFYYYNKEPVVRLTRYYYVESIDNLNLDAATNVTKDMGRQICKKVIKKLEEGKLPYQIREELDLIN